MIPLGVIQQQRNHDGGGSTLLTDLVSWWTMDETSGNRADSEGSNTLTDNATVGYVTGVHGNAADFVKANSEYLDVSSGHGLHASDRDFSFALHYTPSSMTDYDGVIHCGTGQNANQTDYLLCVVGSKLRFYVPYLANWYYSDSTVTMTNGTTYHVYCQFDSTLNKVGISVDHETLVETTGNEPNNIGGSFYVGRYFGYSYGDCEIDELAFWTKLLTTTERTAHENNAYSDL